MKKFYQIRQMKFIKQQNNLLLVNPVYLSHDLRQRRSNRKLAIPSARHRIPRPTIISRKARCSVKAATSSPRSSICATVTTTETTSTRLALRTSSPRISTARTAPIWRVRRAIVIPTSIRAATSAPSSSTPSTRSTDRPESAILSA